MRTDQLVRRCCIGITSSIVLIAACSEEPSSPDTTEQRAVWPTRGAYSIRSCPSKPEGRAASRYRSTTRVPIALAGLDGPDLVHEGELPPHEPAFVAEHEALVAAHP